MKQTSRVLNGFLILILLLSVGWGIRAWFQPKFPATVAGDSIVPAPRELILPRLHRQVYSNAVAREVTDHNLFRKQRKKYIRPRPPKPKPRAVTARPKIARAPASPPPPPPQPTAPPPKLILTGVMLLNDQKIAIFEGTYSEVRGGRLVQNLKPRRRGYKIGERLGSYRIATINKSYATLSALSGNSLTLTISKTPPSQKIKKSGTRLLQKNKSAAVSTRRTPPATRQARPVPNQEPAMNRVPRNIGPSPANTPPAQSTPGNESRDPLSRDRIEMLRQKSMGFKE